MAKVTVAFSSKIWVPVRPCQEVGVCLTDECTAETTSGIQIAFATVENTGRLLGRRIPWEVMDPRDNEYYEYALTFDTADFVEGTVPTCDCIAEIIPYPCMLHKIIDFITD